MKGGPANLEEIVALARRQVQQQAYVDELETTLKDQKETLRRIQEEDLPAAMAEAALQSITLDTGEVINIKPDYNVGIPADRKEEAFKWLTDHNYESIIKTVVAAQFGKGEYAKAQKLHLELAKKNLTCQMAREVHWQTLKAFVKERIRQAKPVPTELFGVMPITRAEITPPKSK